jgi:antitoxin (DNA-binding transcriptional repressor) of toxin-antitoxin stability system
MITTTVEIHEDQPRFTELLAWVVASHEVLLTDQQQPVVRLSPVVHTPQKRVAGLHAGMAWVSDDFDAPLPDDLWLGAA